MKFMITGAEPRGEWQDVEADEMSRRVRHHVERLQQLADTRARSGPPGFVFATVGLGVEAEVVTVKHAEDRHVAMDGPFPETKEVTGGFDIVEFDSPGAAVEWATAQRRHDTHVTEIRPVCEFWWLSGVVDRMRTAQYEHRPSAASGHPDVAQFFLLTSIEDERVTATLDDAQRRRFPRRVAIEYIGQRSAVAHSATTWLGARLDPAAEARTVRWRGGKPSVSDRPRSPAPAVVAGVHMVACVSRDEAMAWARKLAPHPGQAVEIRPVRGCWWYYRE